MEKILLRLYGYSDDLFYVSSNYLGIPASKLRDELELEFYLSDKSCIKLYTRDNDKELPAIYIYPVYGSREHGCWSFIVEKDEDADLDWFIDNFELAYDMMYHPYSSSLKLVLKNSKFDISNLWLDIIEDDTTYVKNFREM